MELQAFDKHPLLITHPYMKAYLRELRREGIAVEKLKSSGKTPIIFLGIKDLRIKENPEADR